MTPRLAWSIDTCIQVISNPWFYLLAYAILWPVRQHVPAGPFAICYCVTLAIQVLQPVSSRLAWGRARPLVWQDEVVVITGGSRGLGRQFARAYSARGVPVAVLDVTPYHLAKAHEPLVQFYRCDVGDAESVKTAAEMIIRNLIHERRSVQLGTPTILINNAGVVNGKTMLELKPEEVDRNFRVNLMAHFHTIQAFLPGMLARRQGGTIVTIASVLGQLGAAQLSDYAAAKAGLIAMHTSLTAEIRQMTASGSAVGARNVKTLLVKPGQLNTPLFEHMPTPSSFFGPVVAVEDIAASIIDAIDSGSGGVVAEPFYTRWIDLLYVLPYSVQWLARGASGIDRAMLKWTPASKPGK